jgi:hypothetical protein
MPNLKLDTMPPAGRAARGLRGTEEVLSGFLEAAPAVLVDEQSEILIVSSKTERLFRCLRPQPFGNEPPAVAGGQ